MTSGSGLCELDRVRSLLGIFCKQSQGLNICTLNARSIRSKIDELREIFSDSEIHAIMISETWLNDGIPSSYVSIPGYEIYRVDRKDRRGGGVAIYVKSNLKSKKIKFSSGGIFEYICVMVDTGIDKCVLSAVYRPPGSFVSQSADEFVSSLENLLHGCSDVIVGGDFNVNVLNNDSSAVEFLSVMQSLHLNTVNDQPTYFGCCNPSLLDLLFVSEKDNILFHNQLSPISTLDHDLLFMSYNIPIGSCIPRRVYSYRDYNNVDSDGLFAECTSLSWCNILIDPSVNSKVEKFNSFISYLYNKYVPLRVKGISAKNCPWFSQEIRSLIVEREYLYREWRRLRTSRSRSFYRVARNRVTLSIRNAKRAYFASRLDPNLPPKTLWGNLKRFGIHKATGTECNLDPDEMNQFFTCSTGIASDSLQVDTSSYTFGASSLSRVHQSGSDTFSFRCIDYLELYRAIYSIKSNAVGSDEINPRFIKLLLPSISPYILDIINCCLMSSSFPDAWKIAFVSPVAKKTSPSFYSDYRPISILSFLGKVLEKILVLQIQKFLSCNDLLCRFQSGFRSKHSCESALLKVSSDLRMALDAGNVGVLVLLDFSKAFDSIDHSILLEKLYSKFGFSTSAAALISNFLTHRFQQVKINDRLSSLLPLCRGVPQGSVLGPLLFCMYINDLPTVVQDAQLHLYADDVQLYLSRPVGLLEDLFARVNDDLERISAWSLDNHLILNPSKSQSIALYGNTTLSVNELPSVILNNSVVPFVTKVKSLGVLLNTSLKCCDHISATLGRIYGGLRRLWLSADVLPLDLRLKLVRSLILPYFTYGSLIYPKLDSTCKRRVEVAFNDCIRFVFKLRRSAHITPLKFSLLGCTIDVYLKRKALLFLFYLIHSREPIYLVEHIQFLQSRRGRSLLIPRHHSSIFEGSYFVQLARLWNSLPARVQGASSVNEFKRLISLCDL